MYGAIVSLIIDPKAHVGSIVTCASESCARRDDKTLLGRLQEGTRQIVLVFAGNAEYKGGVVELLPADGPENAESAPARTHHVRIPLTARVRCYRCEEVIGLGELRPEHVQGGGVRTSSR